MIRVEDIEPQELNPRGLVYVQVDVVTRWDRVNESFRDVNEVVTDEMWQVLYIYIYLYIWLCIDVYIYVFVDIRKLSKS